MTPGLGRGSSLGANNFFCYYTGASNDTSDNPLANKALTLIEQARYRMGTSAFVEAFIDQWAYLQTGLYPPANTIPDELQPVAIELSHVLSAAMKQDPTSDVIGYVLSMSGFHKKGTNYFPTPPGVGRLLSQLVGSTPSADFSNRAAARE